MAEVMPERSEKSMVLRPLLLHCFSYSILILVFAWGGATGAMYAQTPGIGVKDPQAVQVLLNSIAAMGGAQALAATQDSVARGTLTILRGVTRSVASITIKTKGSNRIRSEITEGGKQRISIQRSDVGATVEAGKSSYLPFHNTYNKHVQHIPAFSQMSGYSREDFTIEYKGLGTFRGKAVHIIAVIREDPQGPASRLRELTPVDYFIDSTSFLPVGMLYVARGDNDRTARVAIENVYSDYRRVGGLVIPFQMTRSWRGREVMTLQLTDISFNLGVSDQEFAIP